MSENNETKKIINKATEYPVIYSYIYERESQDIRRLAGKFTTPKRATKKTATPSTAKVIIGFKIEDGKAIPLYSDKPAVAIDSGIRQSSKLVVAKKGLVKRKAPITTKKRTTSRRRTNKNNPGDEN